MSASMAFKFFERFRSTNLCHNSIIFFRKCVNMKPRSFSYSTLLTVLAANANESDGGKLQPPDPSKLTHGYLIKNAASQTIDCVSTLITQTALAIIETEKIYKESVDLLAELLEYQLTILGIETSEYQERTWDAILAIRAKLNTAKFKRQELFLLMSSVEKLAHDAGEVAFIAGSEYSATCSAERLQSAKIQIGLVREASSAAEKRLQDLEIQVIEMTSKHEQEKAKQDKVSDDIEAETENVSEDNMPMSAKDAKSTEDFMSSGENLIT